VLLVNLLVALNFANVFLIKKVWKNAKNVKKNLTNKKRKKRFYIYALHHFGVDKSSTNFGWG